MKKIVKLLALICVTALLAGCSASTTGGSIEKKEEPKSETVITVNGVEYNLERFNLHYYDAQDEVLKSEGYANAEDIPNDFWEQKKDGKTNLEIAKEIAVDNLIKEALAYEKALELGITITTQDKSDITNKIAYLKQDNMTADQFATIGISEKEMERYYTETYHFKYIVPKLIEKGELAVDETAAQKILTEDYIKVQQILIFTINPQTEETLSENQIIHAEERAQYILEKINEGEDFVKLAEKYTETADIEFIIDKKNPADEFEEASIGLEEEWIAGPVYSEYGIHIIKRVPLDLEGEAEKKKLSDIHSQLVTPHYEAIIEEMQKNAKIEKKDDIINGLKPTIVSKK